MCIDRDDFICYAVYHLVCVYLFIIIFWNCSQEKLNLELPSFIPALFFSFLYS